jgi:hypothetical protein
MDPRLSKISRKAADALKGSVSSIKKRLISIDLKSKNTRIILTLICTAIIVGLLFAISLDKNGENGSSNGVEDAAANLPESTPTPVPSEAPEETKKPAKALPVIDLSDIRTDVETSMLRINSPVSWEKELIYSAGNASTIDEPVLVDLYIYNMDTKEEKRVAQTQIQFGEIYEGRFNQDYIVWLDTNQRGTNIIYALNRAANEVLQIKKSEYTHPQLRLFGDNLVWVEQVNEREDRLYLYNLKSGEPIVLETFDIPSYGTCPPSIFNDVVVWAYPSPHDPDKSILKKLDLSKALSVSASAPEPAPSEGEDSSNAGEDVISGGDPDEVIMEVISPEEGTSGEEIPSDAPADGPSDDNSDSEAQGDPQSESPDSSYIDTTVIEPQGFAIYPSTNGQAIAWLDNLNPSLATLKLTLDDGKEIIEVAKDVGRIFGVGKSFVAYMKDEAIMLYFWEQDRYARLTAVGEAARLSSVSGNTVVWYDANDPSQSQDKVKVSVIDVSQIKELN